ncbi:MAG: PPOX class F420-dependent oxidoreductase [Dehalococcoidia bacterium]
MPAMTPDQRDEFLRATRIAKLATLRDDGAPSVVPVWFEWDGERARVFSSEGTGKLQRIRHDPRVALSVEAGVGEPENWVTIEGTAEVLEQGGFELASRLAPRYYGAEKAAATLKEWVKGAASMRLIEITPKKILSG